MLLLGMNNRYKFINDHEVEILFNGDLHIIKFKHNIKKFGTYIDKIKIENKKVFFYSNTNNGWTEFVAEFQILVLKIFEEYKINLVDPINKLLIKIGYKI